MNDKTNLDNIINNKNYIYINDMIIKNIEKSVKKTFPKLISEDQNYLFKLTCRTIDKICVKFNFKKEDKYYQQWLQNNNQDIVAILIMHLPFLDSVKDDGNVYKSLTNLSRIMVNNSSKKLTKSNLKETRQEMLKKELYYSNISIDYLDDKEDVILDANEKKYSMLYQKFLIISKTLDIVANKLYINWVNLQPLNMDNYETSQIYIDTLNNFESNDPNDINYNNSSLDMSNYYNIIRNYIYNDLKKIKWMIYCRNVDQNNGFYFIQILGKMFDLELILKYNNYNLLISNEKERFDLNFKSIIKNIISEKKIIKDNSISLNLERDVLKAFFKFMVSNDNSNNFNDNVYEVFREKQENEELEDNERYQNISNNNLVLAFKKLENKEIFWNYLRKSLLKLRYNYLGSLLFDSNKLKEKFYYYQDTRLTLKNIYNFAKYLSFDNRENRELLENKYYDLENNNRLIFWQKIFDPTFRNDSFRINRNLRLQFDNNVPQNWMNDLINDITSNINTIVWQFLIYNGLVCQFIPRPNITNKKIKSDDKNYIENLMKDIIDTPDNRESYYFLTNDKYKKLKLIDNNKETSYFKSLYKKTSWEKWYNFYAMNWICQIDFFMHFIFLNDCFITGATGQGKSTQCPKLYAYACKAFIYKSNPVILCSQPRLDPTSGNTERISGAMGVPIFYKKDNKKISSDLYYLQFKHSKDDHVMDNLEHPIIRMTTDGTLLMQVNKNICGKKKYYNIKTKKWELFESNIFDVVLVDEAHEHNTNMDLILTSLKYTLKLNPTIKVGIISATMDDDEPVYRYFFKNKPLIFNNMSINNSLNIDLSSFYLDKRFHISPAGETTRYKIREFYSQKEDKDNIKERSIRKVKDICDNSNYGQILLFSSGQAEIISLIEELNRVLPTGIIAIPYFSKMNEKYKDIVRNIEKELSTLKNKKLNIAEEWGDEFIEDFSVPNNIYKRAVIIATNVAEASITIPGLKFVVDNGYAKVNYFNATTKTSLLLLEEISEASRLQRKGRVGRIASGDVHYLYPKGAREDNLPKYKITQENIGDIMINSIIENDNDIDFCLSLNNTYNSLELLELQIQNKIVDEDGSYYIINPFEDKIKRNILGKIIEDNYGNKIKKIPDFFYNQFIKLLLDKLFIVVSQEEDKSILENMNQDQLIKLFLNKKIKITNNVNNSLSLKEILNKFLSWTGGINELFSTYEFIKLVLTNYNQLDAFESLGNLDDELNVKTFDFKINNIEFKDNNNINLYLKLNKKINIIETEFHKINKEVASKLVTNKNKTTTLLIAKGIGIENEIILILPLLDLIERSGLAKLASSVKIEGYQYQVNQLEKLKKKFKSNNSDIYALFQISNDFRKKFSKLKLFKYINDDINIEDKLRVSYNKKKQYFNLIYNENNKLYKKNKIIDGKEFNLFVKILTKEKYTEEQCYRYFIKELNYYNKIFVDDFKKNKNVIKDWCNNNYLNFDIISNYYEELIKLYVTVKNYDLEVDENLGEKNYFEIFGENKKFKIDTQRLNLQEKIELSFLLGFNDNLMIRNDDLSYSPFDTDEIKYNIMSNFRKTQMKTFVKYPAEIICCYNRLKKNEEEFINIIFNVNINFLGKFLTNKFNKKVFKLYYPIKKYDERLKKMVIEKIKLYNSSDRQILYNKIYNSINFNNNLFFNKEFPYLFEGFKNLAKKL